MGYINDKIVMPVIPKSRKICNAILQSMVADLNSHICAQYSHISAVVPELERTDTILLAYMSVCGFDDLVSSQQEKLFNLNSKPHIHYSLLHPIKIVGNI